MNKEIKQLMEWDEAYHNGDALVPDVQYDEVKIEAQKRFPNDPYFMRVGADTRGGKIKLPYVMGSLTQIYKGDVEKWVSKYQLGKEEIVISDKLDGVSCMLQYKNGQFQIAYSRGNGVQGADISRHIKKLPSIPMTITGNDHLTIRGEVIMKNDVFEKNYAEDFANPRNLVAGAMNRKETNQDTLNDIDFIAYQIVDCGSEYKTTTQIEDLELLNKLGFKTVPYVNFNGNKLNDDVLTVTLAAVRNDSDYELDGIVLTINKDESQKTLSNSSSLNPEHSVKYKVLSEGSIVKANVVDVIWEISKSGFYKPRVEISPVRLFGTTVTYATGFNAKFIYDNAIGPGTVVSITKSGSVIPYILNVTKPTKAKMPYGDSLWEWNESEVEAIVINPDSHPEVIFKQVLSFFETLDVDLLKEATLKKVFDIYDLAMKDYEFIIEFIIDLMEIEWTKVIGSNGEKIYASLQRRLENLTMAKYLGATKYLGFGFGVRKANLLLKNLDKDTDVWNLTVDDIVSFEGFDTKTAEKIVDGLQKASDFIQRLQLTLVEEEKGSELNHLNVVFTGFRDKEFQEKLEKNGAKVSTSVSKKTTHLITAEPNSTSSKAKKARDVGVTVLSLDEFKEEFNL